MLRHLQAICDGTAVAGVALGRSFQSPLVRGVNLAHVLEFKLTDIKTMLEAVQIMLVEGFLTLVVGHRCPVLCTLAAC